MTPLYVRIYAYHDNRSFAQLSIFDGKIHIQETVPSLFLFHPDISNGYEDIKLMVKDSLEIINSDLYSFLEMRIITFFQDRVWG